MEKGVEVGSTKHFGSFTTERFDTIPHLLQLFKRMMQHIFVVTLQKRFVDHETSHQHEGE